MHWQDKILMIIVACGGIIAAIYFLYCFASLFIRFEYVEETIEPTKNPEEPQVILPIAIKAEYNALKESGLIDYPTLIDWLKNHPEYSKYLQRKESFA